ncbi:MAG: response regulator transcription factor [Actinobacteria bacterium]|nr:response regulator transcription factor [Actinomycetota bacterium]
MRTTCPDDHLSDAPSVRALVAVADDRPVVRAGVRAALTGAGHVVAEATLSQTAEAVRATSPRVVVVASGGDDPAAFQAVAAAKTVRGDVPVLLLSDDFTAADLRDAVSAGADGFVVTSAPLAELCQAVAAVARGEPVIPPQVAIHLVEAGRGDAPGSEPPSLTARERDVLRLLADGLTNQQIAERLVLSPRTVKTHVANLVATLGVSDRTGAVARGFRLGLIR